MQSWEQNWGHECRDDVSPDIYRCDEFGLDILQKFSCSNCDYSFADIAENCAREGKVCVQSKNGGGRCVSRSGSGDGPEDDGGEVPDLPGNDKPDDSHDVFSLSQSIQGWQPGNIDSKLYGRVAVLKRGYYLYFRNLLRESRIPFRLFSLGAEIEPEEYPVLVVASGGLYGLSSGAVRAWLEDYVAGGGTLIVFAQQHGYDYELLPGGMLGGYGWIEDQQCQYASVVISTYFPAFAGLGETLDANVDGFFTTYPANATVLLTRTKNGQPAMVMYPYGNGTVIATTLYSDMARGLRQGTEDEATLVRNLMLMHTLNMESHAPGNITLSIGTYNPAIAPLRYPVREFAPGEQVSLSVNITTPQNTSADGVSFVVFDPSYRRVAWVNLSRSIAANTTQEVNFSYTLPANAPGGIWSVLYLLSSGGSFVSAGYAAEFAVNYSIAANSRMRAVVTVRDPEGAIALERNLSFTVLPGAKGGFNITFNATREGIWVARYTILDSSGRVHTSSSKPFAVSRFYRMREGFGYRGSDVVLTVTSDREEYPYKSPAVFTFHLWNHGDEDRNVTVTWGLMNHYMKGVVPKGEDPLDSSYNRTVTVPAGGNASFLYTLPEVRGLDRLRANLYVGGRKVGSVERGFWMYYSYVRAEISGMRAEYLAGEVVNFSLGVYSVYYTRVTTYPHRSRAVLRIFDPSNRLVAVRTEEFNFNLTCDRTANAPAPLCRYYANLTPALYIPMNATPGAYRLTVDVETYYSRGRGRVAYTSSFFMVRRSDTSVGFDRPFYRTGENLSLRVVVKNGRNESVERVLNLSIPSLNFSERIRFNLSPGERGVRGYSFPLPATLGAGLKRVLLTSGNTTLQTGFYIPPAQLSITPNTGSTLAPGDALVLTLHNAGGVAASYSLSLRLTDTFSKVILNRSVDGVLGPGRSRDLSFYVPEGARSGRYILEAEVTNRGAGGRSVRRSILNIKGVEAEVSVAPQKRIYATGEAILAEVNISGTSVKNATLKVTLRPTKPVVMREGCVVPRDNLVVNRSIRLCPGVYQISDSGWYGVIIIKADNVVVDGTGVTLIGTGIGRGIYNWRYSNITIQGIRLSNYHYNIESGAMSGLKVDSVTLENGRYGIYLQSVSEVVVRRSTLSGNMYGIYSKESNRVDVLQNIFEGSLNWAIMLKDDDWGEQHSWRVEGNTMADAGILLISEHYPFYNITIRDNRISGTPWGVALKYDRHEFYNISITGNTFRNTTTGVVRVEAVNSTIANNTAEECTGTALWLKDAGNLVVTGNRFSGNCSFYLNTKIGYGLATVSLDPSNTINGKPIYLLVNESGRVIVANASFVAAVSSRGIVLKDLSISGGSVGVFFLNVTSSRIENFTAAGGGGVVLRDSSEIEVLKARLVKNSVGIGLYNTNLSTLRHVEVLNSTYSGIVLQGSSHNRILDSTVMHNGYYTDPYFGYRLYSDGILIEGGSGNNTVRGSVIGFNGRHGIYARDGAVLLRENRLLSNRQSGILLNTAGGSIVESSTVASGSRGVEVYTSAGVQMSNNTMWGNGIGVYLTDVSNSRLVANNVSYNRGTGIYVFRGRNLTLANNTLMNNSPGGWGSAGLMLYRSEGNLIAGNLAGRNYWGIRLQESNSNILRDNVVRYNTDAGISIAFSGINQLVNNTASFNRIGILLYISNSNSVNNSFACYNTEYDISTSYTTNTGYGNTCNTTSGWNDYGRSGCTSACPPQVGGLSTRTGSIPATAGRVEAPGSVVGTRLLGHEGGRVLQVGAEAAPAPGRDAAPSSASSLQPAPAAVSGGVERSYSLNLTGEERLSLSLPGLREEGKYYLHAVLYSPTGQVIAEAVAPVYVTTSQVALTMQTDRRLYRTGEEVKV
ncbi:MAG: hypothetical protein GXO66_05655, partial [Euryarchaeota archaeon]|nr:hypothetical protein [Euryarchaeota archaeon]